MNRTTITDYAVAVVSIALFLRVAWWGAGIPFVLNLLEIDGQPGVLWRTAMGSVLLFLVLAVVALAWQLLSLAAMAAQALREK